MLLAKRNALNPSPAACAELLDAPVGKTAIWLVTIVLSVPICCSQSVMPPPHPLLLVQSFWTRLSGKYGNKFYWQEKGEAAAILDAGKGGGQVGWAGVAGPPQLCNWQESGEVAAILYAGEAGA